VYIMSQVIRIPSDIYSRLEQHAQGFDTPANVIENLLNHFEGVTQKPPKVQQVAAPENGKDRTKYYFNNQKLGKARLVLAVVEKYVSEHADINADELLKAFPKHLQGSIGVFNEYEYVKNKYANKKPKRHFLKADEIIQLNDCRIAVCTQWGSGDIGNIEKFIEQASLFSFKITPTNG
jgi:hypothetical protein